MNAYILEHSKGRINGTFTSSAAALIATRTAFANGDIDAMDSVWMWRVDDEGNVISTMPLEVWTIED